MNKMNKYITSYIKNNIINNTKTFNFMKIKKFSNENIIDKDNIISINKKTQVPLNKLSKSEDQLKYYKIKDKIEANPNQKVKLSQINYHKFKNILKNNEYADKNNESIDNQTSSHFQILKRSFEEYDLSLLSIKNKNNPNYKLDEIRHLDLDNHVNLNDYVVDSLDLETPIDQNQFKEDRKHNKIDNLDSSNANKFIPKEQILIYNDDEDWVTYVRQSILPVVVFCHTNNSSDGDYLYGELKSKCLDMKQFRLVRINIDIHNEIIDFLKITASPSIYLIYKCNLIEKHEGLPGAKVLDKIYSEIKYIQAIGKSEKIFLEIFKQADECMKVSDYEGANKFLKEMCSHEHFKLKYNYLIKLSYAIIYFNNRKDKFDINDSFDNKEYYTEEEENNNKSDNKLNAKRKNNNRNNTSNLEKCYELLKDIMINHKRMLDKDIFALKKLAILEINCNFMLNNNMEIALNDKYTRLKHDLDNKFNNSICYFKTNDKLLDRVRQNPEDIESYYLMAERCLDSNEYEVAINILLSILKMNYNWEDGKARTLLLSILSSLGKGNKLSKHVIHELKEIQKYINH